MDEETRRMLIEAGEDYFRDRRHDEPDVCADDLQSEAVDLAAGMLECWGDERAYAAADYVFEGMLKAEREGGGQ